MARNFIIYPQAYGKLASTGIAQRVEDKKDYVFTSSYFESCSDENENKFMEKLYDSRVIFKNSDHAKAMPPDMRTYNDRLGHMHAKANSNYWATGKNKNKKIVCDLSDLLLFNGEIASEILSPQELWDYKKFGFLTASEFIGTVSAYMVSKVSKRNIILKDNNESIEKALFNGAESNARGFHIIFDSISTPDSFDPFGSRINYKPLMHLDGRNVVSIPHHTKGKLFSFMIKYLQQTGATAEVLKNEGEELIKFSETLQDAKTTKNNDPNPYFGFYYTDIPQLDDQYTAKNPSSVYQVAAPDGAYHFLIDSSYGKKYPDLIISYHQSRDISGKRLEVHGRLSYDNISSIMQQIIDSSKDAHGEISTQLLSNIIKCRFSKPLTLL